MKAHYNLYYVFLEDMQQNPIPEERNAEIRKNIESIYKRIKPPWDIIPLKSIRDGYPNEKSAK